MTFSVAARCSETGMFGVTVASSSICVASRCAFTRVNAGAAQTQNITDPDIGPRLLALCAKGIDAQGSLDQIIATTPNLEWRQIGIVDQKGDTACYSGQHTLGINAMVEGENCVAMGNLLDNDNVPRAMVTAFEQREGHIAERLILALEAGLDAGGEAGPIHSAGVEVSAEQNWPIVDLRVDWEPEPDDAIRLLRIAWEEYKPQLDAYVLRATNPAESEGYGVPGDDRA